MNRTGAPRLVALATALAVTAVLALGAACQRAEMLERQERAPIETMLRDYLPKLARAYRTLDADVLRPMAANREITTVQSRIDELGLRGRQLRPVLQSVTVEELNLLRELNANVVTHEVWDLRVFAIGTDTRLSQELGQVNRVRYQLAKEDGRWQVIYRAIQGSP